MQQRVTGKQPNSRMCLVCGLKNESGLQASFYEIEGDQLIALFTPRDEHQGYPHRLHGGIAAAMLDETIGRAIRLRHGDQLWGVTMELTTRFRRPIPLGQMLRVAGRITRETRRHFEGTGEILLPDGSVAAEARGRYLKLSIERITDFDPQAEEWRVIESPEDPCAFEMEHGGPGDA
jgi:acyl-coenzyme A thioesterase PaaI-like protein